MYFHGNLSIMRLKNEIFAQAVDYLVREKIIVDQKDLAHQTGISPNTISRIMTGKVEPSDDTLRKMADKYGFNMQWLRGYDSYHMFLNDVDYAEQQQIRQQTTPDPAGMVSALVAAKDETIKMKDEQIATLQSLLSEKDAHIETLQHRCAELRRIIDEHRIGLEHLPFPHGVAEPSSPQK